MSYVIICEDKMNNTADPTARQRTILISIILATLPCYLLGFIALGLAPDPEPATPTASVTPSPELTTITSTLITPASPTLSPTPEIVTATPTFTTTPSPTPYLPATSTLTASPTFTATAALTHFVPANIVSPSYRRAIHNRPVHNSGHQRSH